MRKDFLWGGAVAAHQVEGGYNEDGRGLANMDVVPNGKNRSGFNWDSCHALRFRCAARLDFTGWRQGSCECHSPCVGTVWLDSSSVRYGKGRQAPHPCHHR